MSGYFSPIVVTPVASPFSGINETISPSAPLDDSYFLDHKYLFIWGEQTYIFTGQGQAEAAGRDLPVSGQSARLGRR